MSDSAQQTPASHAETLKGLAHVCRSDRQLYVACGFIHTVGYTEDLIAALEAGAKALSQPERVCGTCRHDSLDAQCTGSVTRPLGIDVETGQWTVDRMVFGCSLYQGREDQ